MESSTHIVARRQRQESRARVEAELASCLDGTWPRNLSDELRYSIPRMPYDGPEAVRAARQAHVAGLCRRELSWHDSQDLGEAALDAGWSLAEAEALVEAFRARL